MNAVATRSAVEIVQDLYAAFGRGDVPYIAARLAERVEWSFVGAKSLPYTGRFVGPQEATRFFAAVAAVDDIKVFEPREFIAQGDHVTVLGWEQTKAIPSGRVWESPWVHVFTVRDGKVTRFWGMCDSEASAAAR
jgi:uncharacterized protein